METKTDELLGKLIKNKSFERVEMEQRRAAAWNGFKENWGTGFSKNGDLISTKKKSKVRGCGKKLKEEGEYKSNVLEYSSFF